MLTVWRKHYCFVFHFFPFFARPASVAKIISLVKSEFSISSELKIFITLLQSMDWAKKMWHTKVSKSFWKRRKECCQIRIFNIFNHKHWLCAFVWNFFRQTKFFVFFHNFDKYASVINSAEQRKMMIDKTRTSYKLDNFEFDFDSVKDLGTRPS